MSREQGRRCDQTDVWKKTDERGGGDGGRSNEMAGEVKEGSEKEETQGDRWHSEAVRKGKKIDLRQKRRMGAGTQSTVGEGKRRGTGEAFWLRCKVDGNQFPAE